MNQLNYKVQPNDKEDLLRGEGYEMYSRDVMRKVFPRIIKEYKVVKPSSRKIGDIIPLYFALLSYVNGNEFRGDGKTKNDRFGYAFPSQARLHEMTGIDRKRHKELTDVLKVNGLLSEVMEIYEGRNKYLRYRPSYCPRISDDGFLIDENGEKIIPNYDEILESN